MLWLWSGPPEAQLTIFFFFFALVFQLIFAVESELSFHLRIPLIFIFSEMLHW